jgi:membrane protease YdiL (CAAX protease family)
VRRFFWDDELARPRAGVRIGLHLGALAIAMLVLQLAEGLVPQLLLGPVAFTAILGITYVAARRLDRRSFVDLGLRVDRARAVDLFAGVVVGGASIALVALVESASGVADYARVAMDGGRVARIAFVGVFFVGVAIQEELVFRGYHLVNLTEGIVSARVPPLRASILATLAASIGFGLAHAGNDGATLLATLQVSIAGGTLLAVGFVLTGDLAFSVGVHFAWNFAQCLFGMPVSGFVLDDAAVLHRDVHGADVLTGGAFGPEASVIGLAAMLIGAALSIAYVRVRYGALALRLRLLPRPASVPTSDAR